MKRILLIGITGALLLATGCNSRGGDPTLVLTHFFEAMYGKDIARARSLATSDSRPALDLIEMAMRTSVGENTFFNLAGKQFGEAVVDGNMAIVAVKEQNSGASLEYLLRKEDGSWKVAFDKNAFIDMGIEKMKTIRGNRDRAPDVRME